MFEDDFPVLDTVWTETPARLEVDDCWLEIGWTGELEPEVEG